MAEQSLVSPTLEFEPRLKLGQLLNPMAERACSTIWLLRGLVFVLLDGGGG